ncbi:MAG: endonuclease MutS2 [Chthonomonadales bacterium]
MDAHSLKVLEYPRVLDLLAECTSTKTGREAATRLTPSSDLHQVARLLQETAEARKLLEADAPFTLGGVYDIRSNVTRAARGGVLVASELLEVGQTVAAMGRLRSNLLRRAEEAPALAELASSIPLDPGIAAAIEAAIADGGVIRDTATPELARIRTAMRSVQTRLRERLQAVVASERFRSMIQEPIVTERGGRFCIPVKAEFRTQFGGIVHDASASGATLFMEPASCVELGNEFRALAAHEEHEVLRILARLSGLVGRNAQDLMHGLELCAQLDVIRGKALLAIRMNAAGPRITSAPFIRLVAARHPLLGDEAVPIDVEVGARFSTLLLTGPNTGGKTVTLKTIGLLTLMAETGMQIPAAPQTEIGLFRNIFADIGDEQDIQQSLSTFSAHLRNIARILREAGPNDLALLDEIGAGTDPAEGAALAKALLVTLQERGVRIAATTHYGELKEFAYGRPGIENASVEFDVDTLRPTYRVLLGVPGSSHAFTIAARLGLPAEVMEAAREFLARREETSAEVLRRIEESRRKADEMEQEAARAKRAAQAAQHEYEARLAEIRTLQATVRQQAEEEARALLRRISDRAEGLIAELRKANRGARKAVSVRRRIAELRRETSQVLATPPVEEEPPAPDGMTLRKGDHVRIVSLGREGDLLADPEEGRVSVQIGSLRATLPVEDLRPADRPASSRDAGPAFPSGVVVRRAAAIAPELILRGLRVDEAAPLLERYLDDAYGAGMRQVKLVHGVGSGTLRRSVWETLKEHPVVRSYRLGDDTEGGEGVTIVTLKE